MRFEISEDARGEFSWVLLTDDGRALGDSADDSYKTRHACEEAIELVRDTRPRRRSSTRLPASTTASWSFASRMAKETGTAGGSSPATYVKSGDRPLEPGSFLRTEREGAASTFTIAPPLARARAHEPEPLVCELGVLVRLSAGAGAQERVLEVARPLGVPVHVKAIPVGLALVLFTHEGYVDNSLNDQAACALIVADPRGKALGADDLVDELLSLKSRLDRVFKVFEAGVPALEKLRETREVMARPIEALTEIQTGRGSKLKHRRDDQIKLLHEVTFWFLYSGEDSFRSLLLVGLPGDGVRLYGARNFNGKEGAWTVRVPDGGVAIRCFSLDGNPPETEPQPENPTPTDWPDRYIEPSEGAKSFDKRLSSLKLMPGPDEDAGG